MFLDPPFRRLLALAASDPARPPLAANLAGYRVALSFAWRCVLRTPRASASAAKSASTPDNGLEPLGQPGAGRLRPGRAALPITLVDHPTTAVTSLMHQPRAARD